MPPAAPAVTLSLATAPPKAIEEFGSFEHELPILLAWCPAMNAVLFFTTIGVSRLALLPTAEQIQVRFSNKTIVSAFKNNKLDPYFLPHT